MFFFFFYALERETIRKNPAEAIDSRNNMMPDHLKIKYYTRANTERKKKAADNSNNDANVRSGRLQDGHIRT